MDLVSAFGNPNPVVVLLVLEKMTRYPNFGNRFIVLMARFAEFALIIWLDMGFGLQA